jgi:WD40 repeat protein
MADPALPREVRIWTIETGHAVVLKTEVGIDGARFSPKGDLVLTDSAEETTLWDTEGRPLATLPRGAMFLGDHFLCTEAMGPDFICSRAGKKVVEWEGWSWPSPDRGHVLTCTRRFMSPGEKAVRVLATDGREVAVLRGHEAEIKSADFSRTGSRIITVAADRTARVWDLKGNAIGVLRHGTDVEDAQLSPDGDRVVTRTADGAFHVWDLGDSGQVVVRVGKTAELPVAAFAGSPEKLLVHAGGEGDPGVALYDVLGGLVLKTEGSLCLPDLRAAFTREGDAWLLAGDGVRLIDLHGNVRATYGAGTKFDGALFSPSGREILGARMEGCVLWDRAGSELAVLPRGGLAPCFSPDGDLVVGAGREGPASLFRRDGTELSAIDPGEGRGVITAAFHPTRRLLLAVSARIEIFKPLESLFQETDISLWDISDPCRPVRRWSRPGFLAAEFSPSGERILTPSPDNAARLFDLAGNEATPLRGHTGFVVHACFSPSGDRIVTTSMDGTARLWDEEGRLLEVLRGHAGPVIWAGFSPSGREMLTTAQDETVRIWPVYADDLLALADRRASRELTAAERERYAELLVLEDRR